MMLLFRKFSIKEYKNKIIPVYYDEEKKLNETDKKEAQPDRVNDKSEGSKLIILDVFFCNFKVFKIVIHSIK